MEPGFCGAAFSAGAGVLGGVSAGRASRNKTLLFVLMRVLRGGSFGRFPLGWGMGLRGDRTLMVGGVFG